MDRVEIFGQCSVNEFNEMDFSKSEKLMGDLYPKFDNFCRFLQRETSEGGSFEKNVVNSVSCDINNEGIAFHVHLTDGNTKDISFSNEDTETVDENTKVVIQYKEEISE